MLREYGVTGNRFNSLLCLLIRCDFTHACVWCEVVSPQPISASEAHISHKVDFDCCPVIARYDTRLQYDVSVFVCTVNFKYVCSPVVLPPSLDPATSNQQSCPSLLALHITL